MATLRKSSRVEYSCERDCQWGWPIAPLFDLAAAPAAPFAKPFTIRANAWLDRGFGHLLAEREVVAQFLERRVAVNLAGMAQPTTGISTATEAQPFPEVPGLKAAIGKTENVGSCHIVAPIAKRSMAI